MADIAAHLGVSRTLVSMVIRGAPGPSSETRAKILAAAEELGYHPDIAARTLRGVTQQRVGVFFDMTQPFEVELVEDIYRYADEIGYSVIVGPLTATRDQGTVLRELLGYRADALIVIAPSVDLKALGSLSQRLHIPVVELGRRARTHKFSVVRTDDAAGVKQGVDHLVELGHRAIAHIDGGDRPGAAERRQGYRRRMVHHGLDAYIDIMPGDYTEESGSANAKQLLQRPNRPTAIIAGNDRAAVGVLNEVRKSGLEVPTDVSVVGFDDSPFARLSYIGLTTVKQDSARMAQCALDTLARQLEDHKTAGQRFVLPPTLVIRESTGPAPG